MRPPEAHQEKLFAAEALLLPSSGRSKFEFVVYRILDIRVAIIFLSQFGLSLLKLLNKPIHKYYRSEQYITHYSLLLSKWIILIAITKNKIKFIISGNLPGRQHFESPEQGFSITTVGMIWGASS